MRTGILMLTLNLALGSEACVRTNAETASAGVQSSAILSFDSAANNSTASKLDFETQVKPIFQSRCQPCHFQGGQVYDKMPFDKPETITRLGEKLFTRIKDEKVQRVIREFLSQP